MKRAVSAAAVAALVLASAVIAPCPSRAQTGTIPCGEIEQIIRVFDDMGFRLFREMRVEDRDGAQADGQLWLSPSGDWGLLIIGNGLGCLVASGTGFRLPRGSL